jgi:hypothetical protein
MPQYIHNAHLLATTIKVSKGLAKPIVLVPSLLVHAPLFLHHPPAQPKRFNCWRQQDVITTRSLVEEWHR